MTNLEGGMSYGKYMELYTLIYNYCTSSRMQTGFTEALGANATNRGANLMGADLYNKLKDYLKEHLDEIRKEESQNDEGFLTYYTKEWTRFTTASTFVHHIFRYLNLHWIKGEINEGHKNIYDIYSISRMQDREIFKVCLGYWQKLVSELYEEQNTLPAADIPLLQLNAPGMARPSFPRAFAMRKALYAETFSLLRAVMIERMAEREEVLTVEAMAHQTHQVYTIPLATPSSPTATAPPQIPPAAMQPGPGPAPGPGTAPTPGTTTCSRLTLSDLVIIIFLLLGTAQLILFFYYGHFLYRFLASMIQFFILTTTFFVILAETGKWHDTKTAFKVLNRCTIYRHYYVFFTAVMLVMFFIFPGIAIVKVDGFVVAEGTNVRGRVYVPEDCSNPHVDLQSATPVNWTLTDSGIEILSIPPYTEFRVPAYCGDLQSVIASETYFSDGYSVRSTTPPGDMPVAANPDNQITVSRMELVAKLPGDNPFYKAEPLRTILWSMFGIVMGKFVGRVGYDVFVEWRERRRRSLVAGRV
ncbi:hypothetical protein HDV00_002138 [Rhizophlyctis rosea]|nr:hypothetical protein HDV00_002138 [Rhizophlyctis rosea]